MTTTQTTTRCDTTRHLAPVLQNTCPGTLLAFRSFASLATCARVTAKKNIMPQAQKSRRAENRISPPTRRTLHATHCTPGLQNGQERGAPPLAAASALICAKVSLHGLMLLGPAARFACATPPEDSTATGCGASPVCAHGAPIVLQCRWASGPRSLRRTRCIGMACARVCTCARARVGEWVGGVGGMR